MSIISKTKPKSSGAMDAALAQGKWDENRIICANIESEMAKLQQNFNAVKEKIDEVKRQAEKLEWSKMSKIDADEAIKDQIKILKGTNERSINTLSTDINARLLNLVKQVEVDETKLAIFQQKLAKVEEHCKTLEDKIDRSKQDVRRQNRLEIENHKAESMRLYQGINNEQKALSSGLDHANAQIQILSHEKDQLQQELIAATAEFHNKIASLETTHKNFQDKIASDFKGVIQILLIWKSCWKNSSSNINQIEAHVIQQINELQQNLLDSPATEVGSFKNRYEFHEGQQNAYIHIAESERQGTSIKANQNADLKNLNDNMKAAYEEKDNEIEKKIREIEEMSKREKGELEKWQAEIDRKLKQTLNKEKDLQEITGSLQVDVDRLKDKPCQVQNEKEIQHIAKQNEIGRLENRINGLENKLKNVDSKTQNSRDVLESLVETKIQPLKNDMEHKIIEKLEEQTKANKTLQDNLNVLEMKLNQIMFNQKIDATNERKKMNTFTNVKPRYHFSRV